MWQGRLIEYKGRWRGPEGKQSWVPRSVMVEPGLFPESSLLVLHEFEAFDAARKARVSRMMVEKAATRIQTLVRGFLALRLWCRKKDAAILIQTTFRASHNLLEPRRQRLLAERYRHQMEVESQRHREQAERARSIGHKVLKSELEERVHALTLHLSVK